MNYKRKTMLILEFTFIICFLVITNTFSKYTTSYRKVINLNVTEQRICTITYHSNTTSNNTSTQSFDCSKKEQLTPNTYTNGDLVFSYWNTKEDGSGTNYIDKDTIDLSDGTTDVIDLYAQWVDGIAEVNSNYYKTIQAAINTVEKNNIEATVRLLKDTNEYVTIAAGQNIYLNLQDFTISNVASNKNVIKNYGTLKITNGTITSNAASGAVDIESNANFTMTGGKIIATGTRQAIYNNNGTVTISGDTYLSSTATARATVQNLTNGTVYIQGGTIISTGSDAVQNAGNMTIGIKDDNISDYPYIRGIQYGIKNAAPIYYYDGVIIGKTAAIESDNQILETEDGYSATHTEEIIDNIKYDKLILNSESCTINLNANGGIVNQKIINKIKGQQVGNLPEPTRTDFVFDGWYTSQDGGTKITPETIVEDSVTYYAHWIAIYPNSVQMGNKAYDSLQVAINSAPRNTETTITLLEDITTVFRVSEAKNIIIDLNGHTLNNGMTTYKGMGAIENEGILKLMNGNITSTDAQSAAINNTLGYLYIENVNISVTGTRQAIYVKSGTVEISSNSYITSETEGATEIESITNIERGTITCMQEGTAIVKGGTIVNTKQHAISNLGTVIIGTNDNEITSSTPVIMGYVNGVYNLGTVEFYDGIVKGISNPFSSLVSVTAPNSKTISGTELIDNYIYKTEHLEANN